MHNEDIKVLSIGNDEFNKSLEEIKDDFKHECTTKIGKKNLSDFKVNIIHQDYLENSKNLEILKKNKNIKILIVKEKKNKLLFDSTQIFLPLKFKDLDDIIIKNISAEQFLDNSKIEIKNYILDKNERKLIRDNAFVIITEKEVQLLELFLNKEKPLSKPEILKQVWGYSAAADTHTVETHIYRLRKKIKKKFDDDNFIINRQNGYSI